MRYRDNDKPVRSFISGGVLLSIRRNERYLALLAGCSVLALSLAMLATPRVVRAQSISITGDVNPTKPADATGNWTVGGPLYVGRDSTGELTIDAGGVVTGTFGHIGVEGGSTGTVTVKGAGSTWVNQQNLVVGDKGEGTLNIMDGGAVSSMFGYVGAVAGSTGTVMVTGAGSTWTNTNQLYVGYQGNGTLTIADGGTVRNASTQLGTLDNTGTLHLNGTEGARGVLETGHVSKGVGRASFTFDGGILRATGNEADFLQNFSASDVTIASGGAFIDTNGFNIGIDMGLSGGGGLTKLGDGTLTLMNANSFGGTTQVEQGTLRAGVAAAFVQKGQYVVNGGTLDLGGFDLTMSSLSGNGGTVALNGADVVIDQSIETAFHGIVTGAGGLTKRGTGALTLSGVNTYTGDTLISGGMLAVNGSIASSSTQVQNGGTLGGSGTLGGGVTVADGGTIAPGNSIGTLTVNGNLSLSAGSLLDYELGTSGAKGDPASGKSDRIAVGGNLTLDGTLNLSQSDNSADGTSRPGYYRLITYGGVLTDNGLEIGTTPNLADAAAYEIQTGTGYVDLFIATLGDDMLQHWQGGDGTWNASNPKWLNQGGDWPVIWAGNYAVFKDDPGGFDGGTVTVDGTQSFKGLQFVDEGYALDGGGQLEIDGSDSTDGNAEIRVLADSAAIATKITGAGGLLKTGDGTLILSGTNTYTGGTTIAGGTLQVRGFDNLGSTSSTLTFDGGTLRNTAEGGMGHNVTLKDGGGAFQTDANLTLNGVISGSGSLTKTGSGRLTLSGTNTYTGGTAINEGNVRATVTGALGVGPVNVNQATLSFTGSATAGTLMMTGNQSSIDFYDDSSADGATITGGGISFNDNATAGKATIAGDLDFYDTASADNAFIDNSNGGHVRFHGSNTANRARISIGSGASLDISGLTSGGIAIGSLSGDGAVNLGSKALTLGGLGKTDAISGTISGSGGSLIWSGNNLTSLTLSGTNTYTGGTTITLGTLQIAADANLGAASGMLHLSGGTLANTASFTTARDVTLNYNGSYGGTFLTYADLTVSGTISGSAPLTKNGTGRLILTGKNTYTGGTHIYGGEVAAMETGAVGTGAVTVSPVSGDGILSFRNTASAEALVITNSHGYVEFYDDSSAGAASITNLVNGWAAIGFRGNATAAHATITNEYGSSLNFFDSASAGDALIHNNGQFWFRDSATADGATISNGSGAWLDITNLSSGGIAIGSLSGDGSVSLGDKALTLGGLGKNDTIGGGINGTGSLTKIGTGTLTLSHTNSYTGDTVISGGTLVVNGSIAKSATRVEDGGTLGGSGTLGGVTVADGGTIAPGNSIGTMTVNGDLSLSAGSFLDYELGSSGVKHNPAAGNSDRIAVTGDLMLDGTLNVSQSGNPADGTAGFGYYRLMTYDGALIDGGLEVNPTISLDQAAGYEIQTGGGHVDLYIAVLGDDRLQHWQGGNGIWDASNPQWLNQGGELPVIWAGNHAVFKDDPGGFAGGTITVEGTQDFKGLQFVDEGYRLAGNGALVTEAGGSEIRVLADSAEIATEISGAGGIVKTEAGTLILSGDNSYQGGTTIAGGTLQVAADANLGAASGGLTINGGTFRNTAIFATARNVTLNEGGGAFQTDANLTVSGVISGSGHLVKTGSGRLTLSGTNTYAGGTVINQGDVHAMVTDALGTGQVNVNRASLSFGNSASAENLRIINIQSSIDFYDDSSAGSASIANDGGGTSFNGNSTAGNATIVNNYGSPLGFYGNASAGSATITNHIGGSTYFAGSSTADTASITNNAGGKVRISELTADGIAIGSLSGDGRVILGSKRLTLGGLGKNDAIGGVIEDGPDGSGGSLAKIGNGVLTLTGDNSYTGGTTVASGTLQIGNNGLRGSITGDVEIAAAGTLAFNRSDDFSFDDRFNGVGAIEKRGAGVLALTGDSHDFAGTTTVQAGALAVNGMLGGVIDVRSGARLQGTGTVGTTSVADGGTIAPGNSIGRLSVDGDITFDAGSIYQLEIEPRGASDLIDVTGTAAIHGGSRFDLNPPAFYVPGTRYTILTAAGGVSGSYDALDEGAPFVDLVLDYDPNNVYLDVVRNDVRFCDVVQTENGCSTGTGIDPDGPIDGPLSGVPDADTARSALHLLSGEIYASVKGALLDDSRFVREAALERTRTAFEGVAARPMPVLGYGENGFVSTAADAPFAVWTRGFGSWGEWDSDGNAADLERSTGGVFVGADALVFDSWRLGLLAGYSHTSFDVDDLASSGSSENYHLGLFTGTQWGDLGFRSGLAYSWHNIETNRMVAFPGFSDHLSGDYNAGTFQAFGELGYRVNAKAISFESFANLAYASLHTDDFKESGDAAALSVSGDTSEATFTTLGLRASTNFSLGTMRATARGMLGWRHAFGDTAPLSTHAFTGSNAFTIAGVPIAEDAAAIEAGVDIDVTDSATLGLFYNGQIADDAQDHGVRADFTMRF
ncbi:MAG: autotransporter-associated beta strand repeat-containing protein [Phyllobacterium sp.]